MINSKCAIMSVSVRPLGDDVHCLSLKGDRRTLEKVDKTIRTIWLPSQEKYIRFLMKNCFQCELLNIIHSFFFGNRYIKHHNGKRLM